MDLKEILLGGSGLIIIILTLVQITPLKINPWSNMGKLLRKAICSDLSQQIKQLEEANKHTSNQITQIDTILREYMAESERKSIITCRVRILHFGDELLCAKQHSKDSFDQVLADITEYEHYCTKHPEFKNNMTHLTVKRIKDVYADRLRFNDFL